MIEGLNFAVKHNLSHREMEAYLCFLQSEEPLSVVNLAEQMNVLQPTASKLSLTLRLKGVIELKEKLDNGTRLIGVK